MVSACLIKAVSYKVYRINYSLMNPSWCVRIALKSEYLPTVDFETFHVVWFTQTHTPNQAYMCREMDCLPYTESSAVANSICIEYAWLGVCLCKVNKYIIYVAMHGTAYENNQAVFVLLFVCCCHDDPCSVLSCQTGCETVTL